MGRDARRERTAGLVLLLGFVYLALEAITAAAWIDPPYDWARNYISDLGFSDCAVVDGTRICSPLHPLMNAAFLVQGTVFAAGALMVAPIVLRGRRSRVPVTVLLVASGIGTFFVGVFHQSLALSAAGLNGLHVLAAFIAIAAGDIGIALLGGLLLSDAEWRGYGVAILVIGVVGVLGGLLLLARADLGLGLGTIERIAVYPLNGWTVGTGVGLLVTSYREVRRARARAARTAEERV